VGPAYRRRDTNDSREVAVQLKKILGGVAVGAAAVALAAPAAIADSTTVDGPMGFDPIAGSAYGQASATWTTPFVLPNGFTQTLLSDETTLNIYADPQDDLTDMNVTNETGPKAGRYLYRTHEVGSNGAVSVVDIATGDTKVLAQDAGWRRLDGLLWTPWGTLLFAEETTGGRVFEAFLDPKDPTTVVRVETRLALGRLAHEGIEAQSDGTVYVIDEFATGGIFKFVPDVRADLSSGQLYAIKAANADGTGAFEWVALDRAAVQVDARAEAAAKGASRYERPEDLELIGNTLYAAITSTNRVVEIDLAEMVVSNYVKAGVNAPVENLPTDAGATGFARPDNLADGPDGSLWIVEDNDYSDIWVAERKGDNDGVADEVHLFASLKDVGAEGSGIYFGADPKTLFVNVQHPDKPLADGTWMITKR
jgi:hypothetical protein